MPLRFSNRQHFFSRILATSWLGHPSRLPPEGNLSEGTSDEDGPSGAYWLLLAPLCRLQRPVSATAPMHLHASPAFCFARPLHGNSSASSTLSHPWPTTSSSSLTVRAHPIRQPKCLFYLLSLVPLPASSSSSSASTCPYPTSSSTFSPPHAPGL